MYFLFFRYLQETTGHPPHVEKTCRLREEEKASGIECKMSEKDTLIDELGEQEQDFLGKEQNKVKEKESVKSIRKKAMERMKDLKRKASHSVSEPGWADSGEKSRKSGTEAIEFLKEKANCKLAQWEEEMELRRKEHWS